MIAALADVVLLLHLAFVVFVVFGGLLVLRWPGVAWVHVPAALWGAAVEAGGWVCPLTPLEDRLRQWAGEASGSGDFVERLLVPVLYPAWLTREVQVLLGMSVIAVNVIVYSAAIITRRRRRHAS